MEIAEILELHYGTKADEWHRHENGGGWVHKSAHADATAWVYGNAQVSGNAWVSGNARVSGDARVSGNAWVSSPLYIQGSVWPCFWNAYGKLQIGCESHTIREWQTKFDEISNGRTPGELGKEYKRYVALFAKDIHAKAPKKKG